LTIDRGVGEEVDAFVDLVDEEELKRITI